MKTFIKKYRSLFVIGLLTVICLILLITMLILKNNASICEWWTRNLSRPYLKVLGTITGWIPFSITEFTFIGFVIIGVGYIVWSIILFKKKKISSAINRLATIVLVAVATLTVYTYSVEFAYKREELPFETYQDEIDKTEFKKIIKYYLDDFNYCADQFEQLDSGELDPHCTKKELNNILKEEYKRFDDAYDGYFGSYTPNSKAILNSWLISANGIVGIYFGPLGEAHYNTDQTAMEYPYTIAHEMAHAKGVMREEDANEVAFYLCVTSENPYLRYSAYLNTFSRLLALANYTGVKTDYKELQSQISDKIKANTTYINKHWENKMWLYDFGNWLNDLYLKISGQNNGSKSYDDTEEETDPSGVVVTLSKYQSYYFALYYATNGQK